MKSLYKVLASCMLLCCLLVSYDTYATHATGADLSYTCLGNNQYRITLRFYRDCAGITPDNTTVDISSSSCGISTSLFLTQQGNPVEVSQLCPSQIGQSTCNGGSLPGVQQYTYTGVYTFPVQCADWVIGYSESARNNAVTNLLNASNEYLYVEATLNNTAGLCDNSPVFTSLPVPFECNGNVFFYNHGGVDVDGDSLVYTMIQPLSGPGSPISYNSGYSVANPMANTGGFHFDPATGQMSAVPNGLQNAAIAVRVDEYRNGVKIGSTIRDMQFIVISCPNNSLPTSGGINGSSAYSINIPIGSQTCFTAASADVDASQVVTMSWNNGVPGASFNVSTGNRPVGTFCWTPTLNDIGTYNFVVTVKDNACPSIGTSTYSYTVVVTGLGVTLGNDTTLCASSYTIHPTVTNSAGTSFTYQWSNGSTDSTITVTQSGNYSVTVSDNAGGVGVDSINVTLATLGAAGLIPYSDTTICAGSTVQICAASGYDSYLWSDSQTSACAFNLGAGTYIVQAVNQSGCHFYDTVTVHTNNSLQVNLGPDQSVCSPSTVTLHAGTGFASYLWSNGSNGADLTVTQNGTYSVTVTSAQGCSATDTASVTINAKPFVSLGPDQSVCAGPITLMIRRPPGFTYQWNTGSTDPILVVNSSGNYILTITDNFGCSASDTIRVNISTLSSLNLFANTSVTACAGAATILEPHTLSTTPIASYHWSTGDSVRTITVHQPGTYSLTVYDASGCSVSDTITVVGGPAITGSIVSHNGCAPRTGSIDLTAAGGIGAPYTYAWTGPNGFASTSEDLQGISSGTYNVVITDGAGCTGSTSTTLTLGTIVVDAGPDSIAICHGDSTQLSATGGVFYSWSPAAGLSNASIANPVAHPTVTTTYTVTGSQPSGELVINGDFSQGNTAFTTNYTYTATNLVPEGTYTVNGNPNPQHPAFHGLGHGGSGNFMSVNGAVTPGKKIWCQSVAVNPGTDYSFSTWITTLVTNSPAVLDFTINGSSLATPIVAPLADSTWIQFFHVWNSGSDTSAQICIVNTNTAAGGNDFGLDDISFTSVCTGTDQVTVVVNPTPVVTLPQNDSTCQGTSFTYDAGAGFVSYLWSDGSTNQTLSASVSGTYSVTVTDANGCSGSASALLTVYNCCFPSGFGTVFTTIDSTNNTINADQVWVGKYYITRTVNVNGNAFLDLTNCDLVFAKNTGIIFNDNSRIEANNSVLRPCDESSSWNGLSFLGSSHGAFHQNLVKNAITASYIATTGFVNITNNEYYNFQDGLVFDNAGTGTYDGEVTGNTFTSNENRPIYTVGGSVVTDFFGIKSYNTLFSGVISQNNFVNGQQSQASVLPNRYYGIYLNSSSVSASENKFTNMYRAFDVTGNGQSVTLENNSIENTYRSYTDIYPIRITDVTTSPVLVDGNTITFTGAALGGNSQIGIYVDNTRNLTISGNTVKGLDGLVRIGGGSQFVSVYSNTLSGARNGIIVEGGSDYSISQNAISSIGEAGILLTDVLSNASVTGNRISIGNSNGSYGIRYAVTAGTVNSASINVSDNCVKNSAYALGFSTTVPNVIPAISNNYLYNYTGVGLWNIGFTGQVGSCNNYPSEVGKNSFVSNNTYPYGTALDVRSDSTTLILAGNSGNLVINFPNVLVNTSCNTESNASCGDIDNGHRQSGPMAQMLMFRDMIEGHYPLTSNGSDYSLNSNFATEIGKIAAADRMKNIMTILDILNQNTTSTEMDRFFNAIAGSQLVSANDIKWMSYMYSSNKHNYAAAASYLNGYVPTDANAADLVTIEGIRNNLAMQHAHITALTANEVSVLTAIDDNNTHYSAVARDMVQASAGQHDYKFKRSSDLANVTPGATNSDAMGNNMLNVFPNPTSGSVTVRYITDADNLDKVSIRITDVLGQVLFTQPISFNNGDVTIDISTYASGPYMISLMNGKEVVKLTKLVKF